MGFGCTRLAAQHNERGHCGRPVLSLESTNSAEALRTKYRQIRNACVRVHANSMHQAEARMTHEQRVAVWSRRSAQAKAGGAVRRRKPIVRTKRTHRSDYGLTRVSRAAAGGAAAPRLKSASSGLDSARAALGREDCRPNCEPNSRPEERGRMLDAACAISHARAQTARAKRLIRKGSARRGAARLAECVGCAQRL